MKCFLARVSIFNHFSQCYSNLKVTQRNSMDWKYNLIVPYTGHFFFILNSFSIPKEKLSKNYSKACLTKFEKI